MASPSSAATVTDSWTTAVKDFLTASPSGPSSLADDPSCTVSESRLREARDNECGLTVSVSLLAVIDEWDVESAATKSFASGGKLSQYLTRDLNDAQGRVATAKLLYKSPRAKTGTPPSILLLMEPHQENTLQRISALVGQVRPVNDHEAQMAPFTVMPPKGSGQRWNIVCSSEKWSQLRMTDFFASCAAAPPNKGGRPKRADKRKRSPPKPASTPS